MLRHDVLRDFVRLIVDQNFRFKRKTTHIWYEVANHLHLLCLKINLRSKKSWCVGYKVARAMNQRIVSTCLPSPLTFFFTHVPNGIRFYAVNRSTVVSVHLPSTVFSYSLVNAIRDVILFLLTAKFICDVLLIIVTCY